MKKNLTFIVTAAKLNLGVEKFFYIGEKYKENLKDKVQIGRKVLAECIL